MDKNKKYKRVNGSTKSEKNSFNTNKDKKFKKDFKDNRKSKPMKEERRSKYDEDGNEHLQLEGRNAVLEAINSGRTIDKIIFKKGEVDGTLRMIRGKALDLGIVVQETAKNNLDDMAQTHNHQGVIAICPAHDYVEVEDILAYAKERNEDPFILILDGITDTHNLGAILRTADITGIHGIIIPKRRAAGLTGVVSKTSAGAIEYVKVAKVTNISRTVEELKAKNIWVGTTSQDGVSMYDANLTGALAIVIGSEGEGVSKLVSEKSDFSISIPMFGNIESLNASVATGVVLYEAVRQRRFK